MKAAFHTLGCKVNSYETRAVSEQFKEASFDVVEFSQKADVYIINSCSVTAEAARKSRQITHRARKLNPDAVVVVTGCYAQEAGEELVNDGAVDLVVGNNRKSEILSLVLDYIKNKSDSSEAEKILSDLSEQVSVSDLTHCRDYESQSVKDHGKNVRAYVKIQDGCDRFCAYCLIPYVRGRSRSRDFNEIIDEIKTLASEGYKEVVLTGIDISTFYIDKPGSSDTDLAELIETVNNIEGIERIRLGSLEVGLVTKEFIARVAACSAFCPHFHLSLQSGSDGTLKRMNRHYRADEFYETVQIIRKSFPDAGITTDIIAGFPGETEEEFEETKAFVNKVKFTQAHIFPYSRRKGTKADKMPGQLTKAVKEQRTGILINEASAIQKEHLNDCIGKTVSVLAEEIIDRDGESFAAGYTPEYIRVVFNGGDEFINSIVPVNVTAVSDKFPDTLYGCINA